MSWVLSRPGQAVWVQQLTRWHVFSLSSFEDGLRLVKLRGEVMQAAADMKPSGVCEVVNGAAAPAGMLCCHVHDAVPSSAPAGMLSIVGLDSDKVAELCKVWCTPPTHTCALTAVVSPTPPAHCPL